LPVISTAILGGVNNHFDSPAGAHFLSGKAARVPCGCSTSASATPLGENEHRLFGLRLKKRHTALFVAHLEPPNFSPLALSDAFSDTTGLSK
jgi:hypothetical protein